MQRALALLYVILVVSSPAASAADEGLALSYVLSEESPSEQVVLTQHALWRSLGRVVTEPRSPFTTAQTLREAPVPSASRQRASRRIARASDLIQQMKYPQALKQLEQASAEAEAGLARLIQPRQLSEIHFLRGIALLPEKTPVAQRELILSFALWPERKINPEQYPPRIITILQSAADEARSTPLPTPSPEVGARAASLLKVRQLLVAWPRTSGKTQLQLWLYDSRQRAWLWSATETWDRNTPAAQVEERLTARLRSHLAPAAPPRQRQAPSRAWVLWLGAGVGGAALIGGTVFSLLAQGKASELEELTGQRPLVEFEPAGSDLEDAGRSFRTAAIVGFSVAGAAAITTAIWALWPSGEEPDEEVPVVSVGPGSVQLRLSFP